MALAPVLGTGSEPVERLAGRPLAQPHLDAKPWLTDMQSGMHAQQTNTPLLLAEPAPATLTQMREATVSARESLSEWALGVWDDTELQSALGADVRRWIEKPPSVAFEGFVREARGNDHVWIMPPDDRPLVELMHKLLNEGHLAPRLWDTGVGQRAEHGGDT